MDEVINALNEACMSAVNAGKSLLDAYGSIVAAILAAVGSLGNLGVGIGVAGAITIGGMAATGTAQQQPGQLLGQPSAPITTPASPAASPVDSITGNLPGQTTTSPSSAI